MGIQQNTSSAKIDSSTGNSFTTRRQDKINFFGMNLLPILRDLHTTKGRRENNVINKVSDDFNLESPSLEQITSPLSLEDERTQSSELKKVIPLLPLSSITRSGLKELRPKKAPIYYATTILLIQLESKQRGRNAETQREWHLL
ncbi:hypothetical protein Tco_0938908 [Tanacetum coccineum]|uniref:Uncharacterized protein n=1 Tax=Tanacetum coccineum TaxID=301880 RepID=A0ABQ5DL77_9ASTR